MHGGAVWIYLSSMLARRTHSIESFKLLASTYMAATGQSHWALSQRLFGDGQKLKAILESSADLTSRRLDNAVWWLSDNWPAEAEWPKQLQRP